MPRRQQILLPFIALIALGAGAVGAIALTSQPKTAALRHEVSALRTELSGVQQQLSALEAAAASGTQVKKLSHSVAGLKRTVGGLAGSATPLQVKVDALLTCLPQLQGELSAVTAGRGHERQAAAAGVAGLSPGCAAVLGAG
jgi:hypothetical protein